MAEEQNPPSEREKWETEKAFRDRELTLKEREQAVKEAELKLKTNDATTSAWRNPVVVAILTAAMAAAGNAIVSSINGSEQRILEKQRSEQTRILEMIKTGNPDKAAENLKFLLEAGLITDQSVKDSLRRYLAERRPGSGPTLPSEFGKLTPGIIGNDDAISADTLPPGVLKKASESVGQLLFYDKAGKQISQSTAFLVSENLLLTLDFGSELPASTIKFRMNNGGKLTSYNVILPAVEQARTGSELRHLLLRVRGNPGAKHGFLNLSTRAPRIDESLSIIMFRADTRKFVVTQTADCKVQKIDSNFLYHLCDTGPGSAGAVLLSANGSRVIGIHVGADRSGKYAVRADVIRRQSKIL
ncbi:hypothetical protein BN8_05196 [Fibrisoma limi BUZ 3]|uniref:Serine protease n=1 Tax=Fibrisoma limi BUZ 3 TaxID=1185876 RepID=I2GPS0_9BACT|nr:hypothetical protein [Fibrisoma limi]CCH55898.1 hypothetical protein BN8_05196 [Fibrisoma limi BUZ 3]